MRKNLPGSPHFFSSALHFSPALLVKRFHQSREIRAGNYLTEDNGFSCARRGRNVRGHAPHGLGRKQRKGRRLFRERRESVDVNRTNTICATFSRRVIR